MPESNDDKENEEESLEPGSVEEVLETTVEPRYRLHGVAFTRHPVIVLDYIGSLTVSKKTTVFFEVWYLDDRGARHKVDNQSEIDYIVGVTRKLPHGFELEAGVGYIDGAPLFKSKGDSILLYGKVSKSWKLSRKSEITVYVGADAYIPLRKHDAGGGVIVYAGVKHVWNISEKCDLETTLEGSAHGRFFGLKSGGAVSLETLLRYRFSEQGSVFFGIMGGYDAGKGYGGASAGLNYRW